MKAFLKHGAGTRGPFCDESVPCKVVQAPRSGQTQSGYGSRIPTDYVVTYKGRDHRVYCRIFSNSGTLYIRSGGERIPVDIES